MTNYLLCCDWGTSSFRLQLINVSDYQCIGEVLSAEGVAGTFDAWRKTGETSSIAKATFFRQQLTKQVKALARNVSIDVSGIPIVISGMASSSIGMHEVPYATLPFAVDGSQASVRHVAAEPDFPHDVLLIAGVRSQHDVMRGEETQLIGLLALLDPSDNRTKNAVFIFPGTHSKHVYLRGNQLIRFTTYMTGELFDLMANHSILNDSVDLGSLTIFSDRHMDAFRRGVAQSTRSGVLNGLFTTRTNQLFDQLTKAENAFYLSGLLIGSELNDLTGEHRPVVLCSGSKLAPFYQLAIDALNLLGRTTTMAADLIDRAAGVGQVILFQNQVANQTTASAVRP